MRGGTRRDRLQDTSPARREYSLRTISDREQLRGCVLLLYLAVARCRRGRLFRRRECIRACRVDSKIRGGRCAPKPLVLQGNSGALRRGGGRSGPDDRAAGWRLNGSRAVTRPVQPSSEALPTKALPSCRFLFRPRCEGVPNVLPSSCRAGAVEAAGRRSARACDGRPVGGDPCSPGALVVHWSLLAEGSAPAGGTTARAADP